MTQPVSMVLICWTAGFTPVRAMRWILEEVLVVQYSTFAAVSLHIATAPSGANASSSARTTNFTGSPVPSMVIRMIAFLSA